MSRIPLDAVKTYKFPQLKAYAKSIGVPHRVGETKDALFLKIVNAYSTIQPNEVYADKEAPTPEQVIATAPQSLTDAEIIEALQPYMQTGVRVQLDDVSVHLSKGIKHECVTRTAPLRVIAARASAVNKTALRAADVKGGGGPWNTTPIA